MFDDLARKYEQELFERVIPFWMRHSVDPEHGGFFTCLDREGRLYDDRKYMWLNGRQVWMLSKLYNEVEPRAEWLDAAGRAVAFLRRHGRDAQGRCYFSLTREGLPVFYQRKPYGAVFLMIGLLEYAHATGDAALKAEAIALFQDIRRWIADPILMGRPALRGGVPVSQLADVMVISSMALELAAKTPDPQWQGVMRWAIGQAFRHFEPGHGILIENVAPDGALLKHLPEGRLCSPGHVTEVCWFLLDMLEHLPNPQLTARTLAILENTLEYGWDREYGGLHYFLDIEDRPLFQLEWNMKLWWVHVEAIYAVIRAWKLTGEAKWSAWLERLDDYTFSHFPDPEFGEWFGYLNRDGSVSHSLKGNHYKGCFHIPRALLLSSKALRKPIPTI
ncbi:MAG: N-acylglucosamine 2-epimerase [Acidobacteria bacterium]|nr:N-acylglucosamine 2-epimerase [Acidobacteriota bacterium]